MVYKPPTLQAGTGQEMTEQDGGRAMEAASFAPWLPHVHHHNSYNNNNNNNNNKGSGLQRGPH